MTCIRIKWGGDMQPLHTLCAERSPVHGNLPLFQSFEDHRPILADVVHRSIIADSRTRYKGRSLASWTLDAVPIGDLQCVWTANTGSQAANHKDGDRLV